MAEVQEAIRPVLDAYMKVTLSFHGSFPSSTGDSFLNKILYGQADVDTLKKYCSPEVIERCKAEHTAYQSHGIFFDNRVKNF